MTNNEMLDDLKQYIDIKNTALKDSLKDELTTELSVVIKDDLKAYIKDVVADSTETILSAMGEKIETTDKTLKNHYARLTKLETRAV